MVAESTSKGLLEVGEIAPDFTLHSHSEGELNLTWYRGRRNVLLMFYPGDWTPVCASQVAAYSSQVTKFDDLDCTMLAISVDSLPSHIAWAKTFGGLAFPLMADYYPHGEVSTKYGVLHKRGFAERALFLIDKQGVIRYSALVELNEVPDLNPVFEMLSKIAGEGATAKL